MFQIQHLCVGSVLRFLNVAEKLITQMSEPEPRRCQRAAGCPPLSLRPLHTGLMGAEGERCSVSAPRAVPHARITSSGGIITLSKYDDTVLNGGFAGVSFIQMLEA